MGVFEIGLRSDKAFGGFILGIGVISAFLYSSGKIPELMAKFMILQ